MMFVKNMDYKTNETNVANERLDFLDQARGIGIILVIIGHFYVDGWFTNIIYYFN
jgi:fucose 4-O-acetylase-like acetyltransferase